MAGYWLEWSAKRLPETLKNFKLLDNTRVIIIGKKSIEMTRDDFKKYIRLSREERIVLKTRLTTDSIEINSILRNNLLGIKNVEFIDLAALISGNAPDSCPVFTPEGQLIYYDGSHLTQAGAAYMGSFLRDLLP
ncbi:hypothetical protein FACS189475_04070 [Betaproteobacteria bacterium]|nr:hypothetical protein FACS189475_04070 [Betaproteobacteria bacterium]